ncbi:MAG: hypothetical protein PWP76_69 [Candidatus Diapherotrites archaeon]|nr:hypothetical protein [Candidatus Diapherotrites archaeon]MDN5366952.1 hypothetical protein [Candidatus Diapherotrites archaeon]
MWNIIPLLVTLMMGGASAHTGGVPAGMGTATAGQAPTMMVGPGMMMGPLMMGGDFNVMVEEMREMHEAMERAGYGDIMEEHMEAMEKAMGFECPMHALIEDERS